MTGEEFVTVKQAINRFSEMSEDAVGDVLSGEFTKYQKSAIVHAIMASTYSHLVDHMDKILKILYDKQELEHSHTEYMLSYGVIGNYRHVIFSVLKYAKSLSPDTLQWGLSHPLASIRVLIESHPSLTETQRVKYHLTGTLE